MINYFEPSSKKFNYELKRRKKWLKNNKDLEADNEWNKIKKNLILKKKKIEKLELALNFSKNIIYNHPGLSSSIYFYHPLRVCILSSKINKNISINLMILCLLHNIYETTNVSKKIIIKLFNSKLSKQLEILTVDRNKEWKKNYKNKYYQRLSKAGKDVVITKIIDKLDNLYLLKNNTNEKIKQRYILEIKKYIMPLVKKNVQSLYPYFESLIEYSLKKN